MIIVPSRKFVFKRSIVHFVKGDSTITPEMLSDKPDVVLLDNVRSWSEDKRTEKGSGQTYLYRFQNMRSHEELFMQLRKQYRNEIRHCEKNVVIDYFESCQITNALLHDFAKVTNRMYATLGLKTRVNISLFRAHVRKGALVLSRSSCDNVTYVYHAYVTDGLHACAWMDGDRFREGGIDRKLAGEINKYHKYMDLCWFFDHGYIDFDFGGIASFDHPNGIDQFKMGFPGERVITYEERFPITIKGRLYFWLKRKFR